MSKVEHISIVDGDDLTPVKTEFEPFFVGRHISGYICPLCPPNKAATALYKLKQHYVVKHWKDRVFANGRIIQRCNLSCHVENHEPSHWHCPCCAKTFSRLPRFTTHLSHIHGLTFTTALAPKLHLASPIANPSSPVAPPQPQPSTTQQTTSTPPSSFEVKKECHICKKVLASKKSLQRHMRLHESKVASYGIVNIAKNLQATCVDPRGVYMVRQNYSGSGHPIHVVMNSHNLFTSHGNCTCELESCNAAEAVCLRSGYPSFLCVHLQSVQYCSPFKEAVDLKVETLERMIKIKWLKEKRMQECLNLKEKAGNEGSPFIVEMVTSTMKLMSKRFLYFSVFHGEINHWSKFGRVILSYDTSNGHWSCACCRHKIGCIHKAVGKWFVFQVYPDLLKVDKEEEEGVQDSEPSSRDNTEEDASQSGEVNKKYPPKGPELDKVLAYHYVMKRIPENLPPDLTIQRSVFPEQLIPFEITCTCGGKLTGPLVITRQALILTLSKVYRNIHVFYKLCPDCNLVYRYQEHNEGVHNFDDYHIFSLGLLVFIREYVKVHTAVGRSADVIRNLLHIQTSDTIFRNAYLHFEALTNHSYSFNCNLCGIHPPILIWDLCKKGCFSLPLDDITVPSPSEEYDTVDADWFWKRIIFSQLARGLLRGDKNPFEVKPNYTFWAPWIGKNTRSSNILYNTELRKCHSVNDPELVQQGSASGISEEDLTEMLHFSQVKVLQKLCGSFGKSGVSSLTKVECISFLRKKLSIPDDFKKIFTKVWGASGGWASGSCHHGVTYGIKFVLRGESPRDYVDMLRSLEHPPTITISDIPSRLAVHANNTLPQFFHPHDGRLFDPTPENLSLVKEGLLKINFPWVKETASSTYYLEGHHPISGRIERFSLYDRFHERNSSQETDISRRVALVPELNGHINTEVAEQLYSRQNKSNYFLNMMSATNHMFMKRLLIQFENNALNSKHLDKLVGSLKVNFVGMPTLGTDTLGRLIVLGNMNQSDEYALHHENSAETTTSSMEGQWNASEKDERIAFEFDLRSAVAKSTAEGDNLEALLREKERQGFSVVSMAANGDCCFELMCWWREILRSTKEEKNPSSKVVIDAKAKQDMRVEIAQFQKDNFATFAMLRINIALSMRDWYGNPTGNSGFNAYVCQAVDQCGIDTDDWFNSVDAISLHSELISTGSGMVYGECSELEAFAIMERCQVFISLPGGAVEMFPQSVDNSECPKVYGILAFQHFYLQIPVDASLTHVSSYNVFDDCQEEPSDANRKATAFQPTKMCDGKDYNILNLDFSMISQVKTVWNQRAYLPYDVVAQVNNIIIRWCDIKTLPPNMPDEERSHLSEISGGGFTVGWLNDEIVNAYMHILEKQMPSYNRGNIYIYNSFAFTKLKKGVSSSYEVARRWRKEMTLTDEDILMFPLHMNESHWCLMVLKPKEKVMQYFDPLLQRNSEPPVYVQKCFRDFLNAREEKLSTYMWTSVCPPHPCQPDMQSCGVMICLYAYCIATGSLMKDNILSESAVEKMRCRITYDILTCAIDSPSTSENIKRMKSQFTPVTSSRINTGCHISDLPLDVLSNILFEVSKDEEGYFLTLSLVCKQWESIVSSDWFRRKVHFYWLNGVNNWNTSSVETLNDYYVMYDICKCLNCSATFKEQRGYVRRPWGDSLSFYENTTHPGYCMDCGPIYDCF